MVSTARCSKPWSRMSASNSSSTEKRKKAVYEEPDRLDITREGAPPMLTFGGGVHYCLGANLARIELSQALAVMAHRMLDLRRAGPAPWKPLSGITGPTTLLIEFDAGH